jgi:L-threonylcarbamoyladenylate synthase
MTRITGDLEAVAASIAGGGVVVVPTDTVYGLACDPRHAHAVARIYAIKGRPPEMELSILGAGLAPLEEHGEITGVALSLALAHWPGPLSLIVPTAQPGRWAVPSGSTVSVRVPGHSGLLALLELTGPLATSSANRHGAAPASTAREAVAALGGEVDLVLEGGPAKGQASTIIDCTEVPPRVLRLGPLSLEELRPHLGV